MLKGWVLVCVTFFFLSSFSFALDSDLDGLSDDVELRLGSSRLHKDIFVEIDWFIVNGRNLRPRPGFVPLVQSIFASAPVLNPDGVSGIRIHLELSQGIRTNRTVLGFGNPDGTYNWGEFEAYKNVYFNPSKRATHHYCLFIADMGDENGQPSFISGRSRNSPIPSQFGQGASDFIVALGGPAWYNDPTPGRYKETQAGTFVHELGHNLGLKHGGTDHVTFKPNFLSLLNYSFQTEGIPYTRFDGVRFRIYDYERFFLPPLNENNLNEAFGLGPFASDSAGVYGTTWWLTKDGVNFSEKKTYNAVSFVDWNQDGRIGFVRININQDSKLSTYRGTPQWNKLVYGGGMIGAADLSKAAAALPKATTLRCLHAKDRPKREISSDDANIRVGSYMDIFKK